MPAGLGQLYYTTADDKNLEHLTPILSPAVNFDLNTENGWKKDQDDMKSKGWVMQGTVRIDCDSQDLKKLHKLLTCGKGRLPRKEKKRRINRIVRNKKALSCLIYYCYCMGIRDIDRLLPMMGSMLFPERVHLDADSGTARVVLNMAQHRLVNLFLRRMEKNIVKWLNQSWLRTYF